MEREFTIIGEAFAQMRQRFPDAVGRSDALSRVVDFRNVLVHKYHEVDDTLVWSIVRGPMIPVQQQVDVWHRELSASVRS